MKLGIRQKPAEYAVSAAVAARVFCGLAVDHPGLHNGAWLSAGIGAALAWPVIMGFAKLKGNGAAKPALTALLALINLLDGAATAVKLTRSAGYLALERLPAPVLMLPIGLVLFWAICRGGDAIGYSAAIWTRVFAVLMGIVALMQLRTYRPQWLRPLLGGGLLPIFEGGVRAAGWMAGIAGVFLIAEGDYGEDTHPYRAALIGAGVAAVLIVLRTMMTPTLRAGYAATWLIRLDTLLNNGRARLYLQLPMIVIWYASLLHLLVLQGFTAAALLQRLLPKLDGRACALAAVAAVVFLPEISIDWVEQGVYIVVAAVLALNLMMGGTRACGSRG